MEEIKRSVLTQGQARSRVAAAAKPEAAAQALASGVPVLSLAPQLVRLDE